MIPLSYLLKDISPIAANYAHVTITGLALDSRLVKSGDLFFACQGTRQDGRAFILDAIHQGAQAILIDSDDLIQISYDIPVIFVQNLKEKLADIAAHFYQYPANALQIIGVTGTNGKTSCAHFIAGLLHQFHVTCGVIGTLGNGLYGDIQPSNLTTPDAISLQKIFADFKQHHAKYVAMEVSSHSLDQGRVNHVPFEVGIFTNLTQDHLDYHGSMQAYGAAKRKLFDNIFLKQAVINLDDPWGDALITSLIPYKKIIAYSLENKKTMVPTVFVEKSKFSQGKLQASIITPWGTGEFESALVGQFNLSNLLAVLTTLCLLDFPLSKVLAAISQLQPIAGRMQLLGGRNKAPLVVVDYSHTPDALQKALNALRGQTQGRLFCVFGCGGERDKSKRPMMAQIAELYADKVWVTDDNPRHEVSEQIIEDIFQGFKIKTAVKRQPNRAKAIQDVIQYASGQDCILIAGKGAEAYQQINDQKIPFSDVEYVKFYLKERFHEDF